MLLRCLGDRDYFMIFVPIAQDAIDAEQFEVFLAESFYLLRWVELAAGAGWIFSFAH